MLMKDCSVHLACLLSALNMTHHCQIVHTLRASLFGHGIFDFGIVPFVHFLGRWDMRIKPCGGKRQRNYEVFPEESRRKQMT